jgi:hypothetical protein
MSGAEFERRDRSNGDELIPRVSQETRERILMELSKVSGRDDHLVASYLEEIRTDNPIVAEYIAWVAKQIPKGPDSNHDSNYVIMAGILVYRLLEHEFKQRGKEMPIVRREIADSLKVDPDQEERYIQERANSLVTENYELHLALYTFWLNVNTSKKGVPSKQVLLLVLRSGLEVYELIKAQAEADSRGGQIERPIV